MMVMAVHQEMFVLFAGLLQVPISAFSPPYVPSGWKVSTLQL